MATVWTKVTDKTSGWIDSDYGDILFTEDSRELLQEDELHSLASEGLDIVWSGISDQASSWTKVVDTTTGSWTDVTDESTSWNKVTDESVVWDKVVDVVNDWRSGELGEWIQTEESKNILEENGLYLAQEGLVTVWGGVNDITSDWIAEGVGLKLATEGVRNWLFMEGDIAGIVLRSLGVWTGVADVSSSWTKVADA